MSRFLRRPPPTDPCARQGFTRDFEVRDSWVRTQELPNLVFLVQQNFAEVEMGRAGGKGHGDGRVLFGEAATPEPGTYGQLPRPLFSVQALRARRRPV